MDGWLVGRLAGWLVWGYYVLLGGLTWYMAQPQERRDELWDRLLCRPLSQ